MGESGITASLISLLSSPENVIVAIIILAFSIFLIIKRKNLTVQSAIPYVLYFVLFKGKFGLSAMERWAKRLPRSTKWFGYAGIGISYIGMVMIGYLLIKALVDQFTIPDAPAAVMPVLPFNVSWGFYVPPLYFLVSLFIIAAVHEFAHGVVARRFNLPVNASGFGFLGIVVPILPLAFVEPDEKALKKAKPIHQLAVYSAGPTSNIALAVLLGVIMLVALPPLYSSLLEADGVYITPVDPSTPAGQAGLAGQELIYSIDEVEISNFSAFYSAMSAKAPGDDLRLETEQGVYDVVLDAHPENASMGYLGVMPATHRVSGEARERFGDAAIGIIFWLIGERQSLFDVGLIGWLIILNLGIGLFNFTPLAIVDGGRILLVTLERFFKKEKAMYIWKTVSMFFLALLIANLAFLFIK